MALNKVVICGVNTAKLPLLSEEEKEALFERIDKGDKEAREEFIKGNLRLVLSIIQRFSNSGENSCSTFSISRSSYSFIITSYMILPNSVLSIFHSFL